MITYYLPDVNDEYDRRQAVEDAWWEFEPNHVPAYYLHLVAVRNIEPEVAGDMIDLPLADDGLPVGTPVNVADDGGEVITWPMMYEEAA